MTELSTMKVYDIPLTEILFDEDFNCRGKITPMDVVDLAKSITERGLIQPVTVAPLDEDRIAKNPGKKYLLIAGYRRYTAFKINKLTVIQAIIREDMSDEREARFLNLSENLARTNLNIVQEARALAKLEALGVTENQASDHLQMSRGWVQIRYMVLRLPQEVQEEIAAGWLNHKQIRDAYTHLKKAGKEACFEVVKKFKDDKILGRRGTRKKIDEPKEVKLNKKKKRDRAEIFELQNHIFTEFAGNNIITRTLAWCAGEISTLDFHDSLEEFGEERGIRYRQPL